MWRAIPFILVAGCVQDLREPGAREVCLEWLQSAREKALQCGEDPAWVEDVYRQAMADMCDKVVWADASRVRNVCIPAEQMAACDMRKGLKCDAFFP